MIICLLSVFVVGFVMGNGVNLLSGLLLHIYSNDDRVIEYGVLRLSIIGSTYFLCGMMDVMVGSIRGMGYSIMPMLVSLSGACLFRVIWIYTVFQQFRSLECIYFSYPISWALTLIAHGFCFFIVFRKKTRSLSQKPL